MDEGSKRLFDLLPQYIGITDSDLVCRYANRAYAELLGRSPQSMVGATVEELWGPKLFSEVRPKLQRALDGEELSFQKRIRHLNGEPRFGRVHLLPSPEGGYIVVITDLDEVERQQRDRARLVHELDHRVNNILQVLHSVISLESQAADDRTSLILDSIKVRVDALAISYEFLSTIEPAGGWSIASILDKVVSAIGPGLSASSWADPRLRIPFGLVDSFVFIAMELARWSSMDGSKARLEARSVPDGIELSAEGSLGLDLTTKAGAAGLALVESLAIRCGAEPLRGGTRLSLIFPGPERQEPQGEL